MRGFFGVVVYRPRVGKNVGTLWRTASLYGAAFIGTIGQRYTHQPGDTPKTLRHTPLLFYTDWDDYLRHAPEHAQTVAVELHEGAAPLPRYRHPVRAVYVLGAEDFGLPRQVLDGSQEIVQIPSLRGESMNVSVAGSIVVYDRFTKALAAQR